MSNTDEIINKVAESGLVNFDLSELQPKGKRIGIDLKDFLFQELVLKEKDFREKVARLELEKYKDAFVHVYCSTDAIIPLWAYFLITSQLQQTSKKVYFGSEKEMEAYLFNEAVEGYDFSVFSGKRLLVKGCSDIEIPEQAFVALVQKLKPVVKSLFFGEACSSVPIFKN